MWSLRRNYKIDFVYKELSGQSKKLKDEEMDALMNQDPCQVRTGSDFAKNFHSVPKFRSGDLRD